jgi:hypothetical protein
MMEPLAHQDGIDLQAILDKRQHEKSKRNG